MYMRIGRKVRQGEDKEWKPKNKGKTKTQREKERNKGKKS